MTGRMCLLLLVFVGVSLGSVFIPATDPSFEYLGRVTFNSEGVAGFDWSGVTISTIICGATQVNPRLQDSFGVYNIFVNGEKTQTIHVNPNPNDEIILPSTSCQNLSITKVTEASNNYNGISEFSGLVTNAPSLAAHQGNQGGQARITTSRRLVFVGDGVTCGYGVLSDTTTCTDPSPYYGKEDVTQSYVGYISQSFQAEAQVLCYTGKGVLHNKGDSSAMSLDPMPFYWNTTVATIPSIIYDMQEFVPEAVYINLGTNDFADTVHPTANQFINAYDAFIVQIRNDYPSAEIFVACGPIANATICSFAKQVAQDEGATFILFDSSSFLTSSEYGCNNFPNTQGQQKMADTSIPVMSQVLGW